MPLALSAGVTALGTSTWLFGTLAGTRLLPLFWAVLLAAALPRARGLPRALSRAAKRLVLLGRAAPLAAGASLVLIVPLLPPLLSPLVDSDGLRYHVALPRLFLLQGRVTTYPWDLTGAFPQPTEMLYMAGLVLGSAEAAKLLHAAFFLGTLATLALLLHGGRRTRAASALAPLFLLASPVATLPAPAAFVDHAALFHLSAALLLLRRRAPPAWIGVALAGAVGAKLVAGLPAAAVLLALALALPPGRRVKGVLAAAGVAALVHAPWALRALRETSDPLFPIGHYLLGRAIPGVSGEALRWATHYRDLQTGPMGLAFLEGTPGATADDVVGVQFLAALFALPVVLRERRLLPLFLLVVAQAAFGLLLRPPARYHLPAFLALAGLLAVALTARRARLGVAAGLLLALPGAVTSARALVTQFRPLDYVRGRVDRETWLAANVPGYRSARLLSSRPPGAVMALDFPAPYYLGRPFVAEGVLHEPPLKAWLNEGLDAPALLDRIRSLGVRYLLVTPGYGGGTPLSLLALARPEETARVRVLAELRGRLRLLGTADGVDLYEVPEASTSSGRATLPPCAAFSSASPPPSPPSSSSRA